MKIIQKRIETKEYFKKHLEIVNCLLPIDITEKEIEVLGAFMSLDESITEDDIFNTLARKKVKKKLSLSPGGLSNHLRAMITKGALSKNKITGRIKINNLLIPESNNQGYQIQIIRRDENIK